MEADREIDGTRLDGVDDGWYQTTSPKWELLPGSPKVQLALVEGVFAREQTIDSITPFDACDAACLDVATPFAETSAENSDLTRLYTGWCHDCESSFIALVEVNDGVARSVGRDAAIDLLQPIDTEDEVRVAFGWFNLIRTTEDGWEVIRIDTPPCSTEDTKHGRSSVSFAGEVTELESFVVPGHTGGGGTCD